MGEGKLLPVKIALISRYQSKPKRKVAEAPQQWKDELSNEAKLSPEDQILVIFVPSKPAEPDGAYVSLSGKYVADTEVPT